MVPTDFDSAIRRFDPSRPSQPFLWSGGLPKTRRDGPEIRAFRELARVSGRRFDRSRTQNRRKSPAYSVNIPVFQRLSAETRARSGTAARRLQSIEHVEAWKGSSVLTAAGLALRR